MQKKRLSNIIMKKAPGRIEYGKVTQQKEFAQNICQTSDDDDGGDGELFLWYGWPTKGVWLYLQQGPLSEIFTIANLRHAASIIWTFTKSALSLSSMKLCSSDNH